MSRSENNRLFCRDLALAADPLFRISQSFSDREVSDRLVALYAFFAAVDETASKVSDEEIAARKITWWRSEVESFFKGEGSHPISKELQRSGAAGLMSREWITRFFTSAVTRLHAKPLTSLEDLEAVCLASGMPRLRLELAVCDVETPGEQLLSGMASRRGIYSLILQNPGATTNNSYWWIPSNLLARHGVSRMDLASVEHADALRKIGGEILGSEVCTKSFGDSGYTDISNKKQYIKHCLSYDSLLKKKLQYTKNSSHYLMRNNWEKPRLGDLLTCWRAARKVSLWK